MESFLKDTPLESRGNPNGFRSFIEPEEEPAEDADSVSEEESSESASDLPDGEAVEVDSPPEMAADSIDQDAEAEKPSVDIDLETPAPANPDAKTASNLEDSAEVAPSSDDGGASEIVFEQVDGPKVEVISEDGIVTKIVVHLSPDKILELKCEY